MIVTDDIFWVVTDTHCDCVTGTDDILWDCYRYTL